MESNGNEARVADRPRARQEFRDERTHRWRQRRLARGLFFARIKYGVWQLLTKLPLGLIYIVVISEGIRLLMPSFGQRAHRIPGLAGMRDYEETHRIDLAHFFAVFLMLAVFYLWERLLEIWLYPDEEKGPRVNHYKIILILALVILGADAVMFFFSIVQMGWSGGGGSFTDVIATAAYVAVLVFVSFVSVNLRQSIHDTSKEYYR